MLYRVFVPAGFLCCVGRRERDLVLCTSMVCVLRREGGGGEEGVGLCFSRIMWSMWKVIRVIDCLSYVSVLQGKE